MATSAVKETTIRLACVPEQVNIPVTMMVEKGIDVKHNICVKIVSVPEGTGRMLELLERGEVDVAMTVSDAFVVAKSKQRAVSLAGVWVSSPLVWAIAASPSLPSHVKSVEQLMDHRRKVTNSVKPKLRVGISRLGSGSQSMASYMAMLHNLDHVHGLEFVVANNIAGLVAGIRDDLFDVFLWETFTTKPFFDRRELRQLGDVPTPWPAFSLVTSSVHLPLETAVVMKRSLFPALAEAATVFTWDSAAAVNQITKLYHHQPRDASAWLSKVVYNDARMGVDSESWAKSVMILKQVGLVGADFETSKLWEESDIAHVIVPQEPHADDSSSLDGSSHGIPNEWTLVMCHPSTY